MALEWFKVSPGRHLSGMIQMTSMETQGEFFNLCCRYWIKDGIMPIKLAQMLCANLAQLIDLECVKVEGENVKISFLDEQLAQCETLRESRSRAGKLSAQKRATSVEQVLNAQPTSVEHSPTDKIRREENKENNAQTTFSRFWDLYPKKRDKKRAEAKFKKLSESKRQKAVEGIERMKANTDPKFYPNPTTYINGERWEDDYSNNQAKSDNPVRLPKTIQPKLNGTQAI